MLAPLKLPDRNRSNGTIGEFAVDSTNTKTARPARPTVKLPKTSGLLQPKLVDSTNPNTNPPNPTVPTSAPSQSIRRAATLRLSGICHSERAITNAESGRLMKNTHRHDACSTSHPPTTGPIAVVIAVKPDQVPIA